MNQNANKKTSRHRNRRHHQGNGVFVAATPMPGTFVRVTAPNLPADAHPCGMIKTKNGAACVVALPTRDRNGVMLVDFLDARHLRPATLVDIVTPAFA